MRMVYVSIALVIIGLLVGGWRTVEATDWLPLAVSGFVGLALGDAALFEAFARLGPRRTGILFAANAPLTAIISSIIYDEEFGFLGIVGTILVVTGVSMAIAYGTRPGQSHAWEEIRGSLPIGVAFGLAGALGQAVAVLVADPVFDGTLDPWAGAAVRALVGTVGLFALMPWFERRNGGRGTVQLTPRLWALVIISGTLGMVIGKTMMLIASGGRPTRPGVDPGVAGPGHSAAGYLAGHPGGSPARRMAGCDTGRRRHRHGAVVAGSLLAMEHHADFAIPVSQDLTVAATVGPDDGLGPLAGRVIALGWWVQPDTADDPEHEPTGTLYLIVDERRSRPYWVKQADLATVKLTPPAGA
jgi:drug/metabolite transporter (DMT)-like permease